MTTPPPAPHADPPPPVHATPPRVSTGFWLVTATLFLLGVGMLAIGLFSNTLPRPRSKGNLPSGVARQPQEPADPQSPDAPGGTAAGPGGNRTGGANTPGPAAPSTASATAEADRNRPAQARVWPAGAIEIFCDTPFTDGRPMEFIQPLTWRPNLPRTVAPAVPGAGETAGIPPQALPPDLRIYLTYDHNGPITVAQCRNGEMLLRSSSGPGTPLQPLGAARLLPVALDTDGAARTVLAFAYRDGSIAITQDGQNLCAIPYTGGFPGSMARQNGNDGTLQFGEFDFRAGGEIVFRDDFMRAETDGFWRTVTGAWELESIANPERSSNPFALKAVFSNRTTQNDLDRNRELFKDDPMEGVGAGIQPGLKNNMVTVARITGGGPAALAGLMEEDVILALNGRPVSFRDMLYFFRELRRPSAGKVDLEILRPGESKPRRIVFTPGEFKWADVRLHHRLPNSHLADSALIAAGGGTWQSYHALCALRFLSGGGAGMVLGQGQEGAVALRWFGANLAGETVPANRFQVVQLNAGGEKLLWERPLTPWRDTFYRLHADTTGPDLKVYVDEVLLVTLPGIKAPAGPVALWARKTTLPNISPIDDGVFFDDVEVLSDPARITAKAQVRINRIMKNEQDMKQWANPSHEWIATCTAPAIVTPGEVEKSVELAPVPVVQYRADVPGHQGLLVKNPQPAKDRGFRLYLGLELPPAIAGRILPAPDQPDTAQHFRAPASRPVFPGLEPLGSPLFYPPHLNTGKAPVPSEESRKQMDDNDGSVTPNQLPVPLPQLRSYALEWRWTPASGVNSGAAAQSGWQWEVFDPQTAAPLATGSAAGTPNALALVCTGAGPNGAAARVVGRVNGQEVFSLPRDVVAQVGQSAGVSGLDNWPDEGVLEVSGDQVLEYSFTNAPDDWAVHAGRWGLLNKWVCDPRWSWFGGRSDDGLAAIWHKTQFAGDITVDYYAALMMYQNDPPYERPGDFNCTIFGDGVNQGSGYSLIFGGGDNRYSALTKNGATQAWVTAEAARLPSDRLRQQEKMVLHQRWFHLQLRRVGNTISYSLDGTRWLEFTDAEPIQSGRVALWTVNNGYLLARVRIAYQQSLGPVIDEGRTAPVVSAAKTGEPAATFEVDPRPMGGEWTAQVERFEPVLAQKETLQFPRTLLPAGGIAARQGVRPLAEGQPTRAFHVISPGGGPIALGVKPTRDFSFTQNQSRVQFWFQADPEAAVDLYFRTERGNYLRLRLTGPAVGPAGCLELGDCGTNLADGQWHFLDLDLQARFDALGRDYYLPIRTSSLAILFGALSPCDGQLWGAQCNPAGSRYAIADFQVLPRTEPHQGPAIAVKPTGTADAADNPDRRPALVARTDSPWIAAIPLNGWSGAVIAGASATLKNGQTHALEIAAQPGAAGPTIRRLVDGLEWSLDLLALRPWLADPADLAEIQIDWRWDAKSKNQETIAYACQFPPDPRFSLHGLKLKPVLWTSPTTETQRGTPAAQPLAAIPTDFRWIDAAPIDVDFGAAPPPASVTAGDDPENPGPGPDPRTAARSPVARNAWIQRLGVNPFTGLPALRVAPRESGESWGLGLPLIPNQAGMRAQSAVNPRGKMFRLPGMRPGPHPGPPMVLDPTGDLVDPGETGGPDTQAFPLWRYPLLRIDHRTPFEAPVNLRAWAGGTGLCFTLTDTWAPFTWHLDDPAQFLGGDTFPDDGHWRCDLYDWRTVWQRSLTDSSAEPPTLQNLQLVDNGWPGARKGMFLDYGRLQTVLAARPAEFGVRVADLPGGGKTATEPVPARLQLILAAAGPHQPIGAFYRLQTEPRNDPRQPVPGVFSLATADQAQITSGVYWVYAVATPPAAAQPAVFVDAFPVLIDAAAPRTVDPFPAPDATSAATVIRCRAIDEGLIRARSLRFKVNGVELQPEGSAQQFDPATGAVTIDLKEALRGRGGLKPGLPITVELSAAEDELGNTLAAPQRVTQFTWDSADGTAGSGAPVLAQWRFCMNDDSHRTPLENYRSLLHDSGLNSFEFLAGDGDFRGAGTQVTLTADRPAWGATALRARVRDPLGEFHTTLYEDPWFLRDRPILCFDYRATAAARLCLELEIEDRRVTVPLEGPQGRLLADGAWHHVGIDLMAYAKVACPQMKYYLARKLRIVDVPPRTMLAGEGVDIDNLALVAVARSGLVQMRWETPAGDPPQQVLASVNARLLDTPTGRLEGLRSEIEAPLPGADPLYAHLQAVSRTGQKSELLHVKIWDLKLPIRRARDLGWVEK